MTVVFVFSLVLLIALLAVVSGAKPGPDKCPECYWDVPEFIASWGYPVEVHNVNTPDGYTLQMHRIPHSLANKTTTGRPPVLLVHALLDSSVSWVINMPYQSLAYLLSNAGFDIWLGNVRGNRYGMPPNNTAWNFSWDEMALIDVPTMIDYVRQRTGFDKISYIGHSQGGLVGFTGLSVRPDLMEKINLLIGFAPAVYVSHQNSPILNILKLIKLEEWIKDLKVADFFPHSPLFQYVSQLLCVKPIEWLCDDILFATCGYDPRGNMNDTRMPIYVSQTPAGTSGQNMIHWMQSVRHDAVCRYDFGSAKANQQHYGQDTPPCFDMKKLNVPVALFTGHNDALVTPNDIKRLASELPNLVHFHEVDHYQHLDLTWGLDCWQLIYPEVIALLKKYSKL
eukprot:TRINITY_DN6045_c0_g1_i1.p1 TRINITY_DN6045_c0_g1~~TRINITY_DN6045_c0_g1_i1.p1  ORF type:complete len:395 (-),score=99.02 TRINITY_DN6045_c0_g1_i1:438-1622(-)